MPKEHEDTQNRAALLVPFTLANTGDLHELYPILQARRRIRLDPQDKQAEKELAQLMQGCGGCENPFLVPRRQRQKAGYFTPWRELLEQQLKNTLAASSYIHGRLLSSLGLASEQRILRELLDTIIEHPESINEQVTQLEARLQLRGVESRMSIDTDLDRIRLMVYPDPEDLGAYNTRCLFDLFVLYPISSLQRCKRPSCSRYFIPGAEGRKKMKKVTFCSDACKRGWTNEQRRTSPKLS